MASDAATVRFVVGQMGSGATARAMFGEYGIYLDGVIIGLFCDNRLFLKPTAEGAARLGDHELGPAYPGAKPSIIVPEESWDDGSLMKKLARATADALTRAGAGKKVSKKATKKVAKKATKKASKKVVKKRA